MDLNKTTPIMTDHNSRNGTYVRKLERIVKGEEPNEEISFALREYDETSTLLYEELADTWEEGLIAFSIRSGHAVRKENFERRVPEKEVPTTKKKVKKLPEEVVLEELGL